MLILSRKLNESLIIGGEITLADNIVITILAVEGDKVKLGIRAPREVPVFRQELWEAIQEQTAIAARLASGSEPEGFEELRHYLASETGAETGAVAPPGAVRKGSDRVLPANI
jgi:carbon storage regulator